MPCERADVAGPRHSVRLGAALERDDLRYEARFDARQIAVRARIVRGDRAHGIHLAEHLALHVVLVEDDSRVRLETSDKGQVARGTEGAEPHRVEALAAQLSLESASY